MLRIQNSIVDGGSEKITIQFQIQIFQKITIDIRIQGPKNHNPGPDPEAKKSQS